MKRTLSKRYTAAKRLAKLINSKMGTTEVTAILFEDEDRVVVSWEGGPFEWAPALTGGAHLYAGETGTYSTNNPWFDKVERIAERGSVFFECENSFQISVWEA